MSTIEDAKQLLEKSNANGSVYEHISKLILKLIQEKPSRPLELFESLSLSLKKKTDETNDTRIATTEKYVSVPLPQNYGIDGSIIIQNLLEDSDLLQWTGVAFTEEELYKMQLSMYNLVNDMQATNPISRIRFWGKMLTCTGNDYLVFECIDDALENITPGFEGREGVNKYAYYVLSDDKMCRLPDAHETHLVFARTTKKYLTGNLDVEVSGYPLFPGKEANYLRALISLISSDTAVAPESYFGFDESGSVVSKLRSLEEADQPEALTKDTVGLMESWVYIERCINSLGRMQNPTIEGDDGVEEDPKYASATIEREGVLTPLSEDSGRWKSATMLNGTGHKVGVLKSLQWPGVVAAAKMGQLRFINCYVGYGMPSTDSAYTPPSLPPLQTESNYRLQEIQDLLEDPITTSGENENEKL